MVNHIHDPKYTNNILVQFFRYLLLKYETRYGQHNDFGYCIPSIHFNVGLQLTLLFDQSQSYLYNFSRLISKWNINFRFRYITFRTSGLNIFHKYLKLWYFTTVTGRISYIFWHCLMKMAFYYCPSPLFGVPLLGSKTILFNCYECQKKYFLNILKYDIIMKIVNKVTINLVSLRLSFLSVPTSIEFA